MTHRQNIAHVNGAVGQATGTVLRSHACEHRSIPVTQICLDMRHGMLAPHRASPDAPVWLQYGFRGAFDRSEHIGS